MALRRHVETITISTAENEECRQILLQDFAQQMEANQNVWIIYHKEQAMKQEKFNSDCQQWASEMTAQEVKASANQEKVKKDLQKLKRLQEQLRQDQVNAAAVSQQEQEDMRRSFQEELQSIGEELKVQFQSAQQSHKGIDVTSVIDSILEQQDTTEGELCPDTWPSYMAAMDHYFYDPYQKRNYTNKMARLHWKYKPGCYKTGLPADQWGI
jgi:hypothetical protein